jgi:hypothetical protein
MERDWGFGGLWYGLQSRSALHNPGCAISRYMAHVRYSANNAWNPIMVEKLDESFPCSFSFS